MVLRQRQRSVSRHCSWIRAPPWLSGMQVRWARQGGPMLAVRPKEAALCRRNHDHEPVPKERADLGVAKAEPEGMEIRAGKL